MGYPTSQPAWEQQELNKLSSQGLLSGINPLVLAGIAGNESGYENAGAGINSEGYGGFYGLGSHSTYSYGGQSFTESPSILSDPGVSSFDQQSEAAAAEVASLLASNNGNLQAALAQYTGGGPTNGDYELAMQDLAGAGWGSPQAGSGELVVTGGGAGAPAGGTYAAGGIAGTGAPAGGTTAQQAAFGGSLNPANWPSEAISALKPWIARIVLVIVALILLKVGLDHLLDTDKSPAGIIVDAIPTPKGATKTVSAPGTQRTQTTDSDGEESSTEEESDHEEEESTHEGEDEEKGEGAEGAEEAGEEAPEAAAAA